MEIKPEDILAAWQQSGKAKRRFNIAAIAVMVISVVLLFIGFNFGEDSVPFWVCIAVAFAVLIVGCILGQIGENKANQVKAMTYRWLYDTVAEQENLFAESGSNLNIYILNDNGLFTVVFKEANANFTLNAKCLLESVGAVKLRAKNNMFSDSYMIGLYLAEIVMGKIIEQVQGGKYFNNVTVYSDLFGDMPHDVDSPEWTDMGDELIVQNMPTKYYNIMLKNYNKSKKRFLKTKN